MNQLSTLELLEAVADRLDAAGLYYGHGTDNAQDEAFWLMAYALKHSVHQPLPQRPLTHSEHAAVEALLVERIQSRKPMAYLTGSAWFAGLEFQVTEHVLVPRSPMAELIVNRFSPWLDSKKVTSVLDLGAGSGCIGIAAAIYLPDVALTGVDISGHALAVAEGNARRHALGARSRWLKSDMFEALAGERFDLILSNPPYVPDARRNELPDEYQAEPLVGLYSGLDGLDHAAYLLSGAADHLNAGGCLILEVGESAPTLMEQLPGIPFIWPEFEYGGEGVLIADKAMLDRYESDITSWYRTRNPKQQLR